MNFLKNDDYQEVVKRSGYSGCKGLLRFIIFLLAGWFVLILFLGDVLYAQGGLLTSDNIVLAEALFGLMLLVYKFIQKLNVLQLLMLLFGALLGAGFITVRNLSIFKKMFLEWIWLSYESKT